MFLRKKRSPKRVPPGSAQDSTLFFLPCQSCDGRIAVTIGLARARKHLKCPYCGDVTDLGSAAATDALARAVTKATARPVD